jgi:hypothetical protein
MPLKKLRFEPTINREGTAYTSEPVWYACDKVRIRAGLPETIGGWAPYTLNSTFVGRCRSLLAWTGLNGVVYLGAGTHKKYYIESGGVYFDVTPIRRSVTLTNPFTTVTKTLAAAINATDTTITLNSTVDLPSPGRVRIDSEIIDYVTVEGNNLLGVTRGVDGTMAAPHALNALVASAYIKVTDAGSQTTVGDYVTFSGATAVGGVLAIQLNGERVVNAPDGGNIYYFLSEGFPTISAVGGNTVLAEYQEYTGLETSILATGYGVSPYSLGGYGESYTESQIANSIRIWNHANFGRDLVYGPRGGSLYYWDAGVPNALGLRGKLLSSLPGASDVPLYQNKILVSEARFVLVFGTNVAGSTELDPLLIRWCDQEFPQQWTSTPTNTAGDLRLTNGSRIITAVQTRQEIIVFTDSALYSLQFVGGEDVFTQQLLADNISIAGPNAATVVNGVLYWMGLDKFYVYDGRSQTLDSTLKSYVFTDINTQQLELVFAGGNEGFSEVWWFYPSAESPQNDRYVIFNYQEKGWYYGTLSRSAWLDSGVKPAPVAAADGVLVFHEQGYDDNTDGTPSPLEAFIESGDFDIEDGDRISLVQRIIPDVNFSGSTVPMPQITMQVAARKTSGTPYRDEEAPLVVQAVQTPISLYTEQLFVRVRGRQMRLRVASNMLGVKWQLGFPRLDIRPDGRR